ncbi:MULTISPECIES: hypothetical protein [Delftia]|uniref:Uncharacterized protein n=1 Tax=Delftia deserti TaxID=1651218 RepID=A0ABW5EK27_9BURK|nr:hypothetical protein [Delftia acidovorans]
MHDTKKITIPSGLLFHIPSQIENQARGPINKKETKVIFLAYFA